MNAVTDHNETLCPHGMAGYCEDCPPERFNVGHDIVAPTARVRAKREWPWVVVERVRPNGSLDWFTWHLTRRGARKAADLYVRTGDVVGIRP